jgi:hypothetical protein
VTATQVPFWSVSPQASQLPEQTLSQQTASTQWPSAQSPSCAQAAPLGSLGASPAPPSAAASPSTDGRSAASPDRPSVVGPSAPPSGQLVDAAFAIESENGPDV